jgi:DNA phosphorothioation-associated putative methyltransferase
MLTKVDRHRTAIRRTAFSRPIRIASEDGLITPDVSVFDYGCGHGDDIRHLLMSGINCRGWDPVHNPSAERVSADVVNLGYVINVIENPDERATVLREAWSLTKKLLLVSARLNHESATQQLAAFEEECLTNRQTFQKYYEQSELRDWINQVLGVSSIAAAPGVFYAFREAETQQSFVASHVRRPIAAPRIRHSEVAFEKHRVLLEPLMEFVASRGRLPDESELTCASTIRSELGGLTRAFAIIRRVTGTERWAQIREERSQDLLVYLALARFGGRPRFTELPLDLQLDVRAFFSAYNRSCGLADTLLFSAGNRDAVDGAVKISPVGKVTRDSLYVHVSAISQLPALLRVYEGCARSLIGTVEGANVIKLHRGSPRVSYLCYPKFEKEAHPALSASLLVDLQTLRVTYREYADSGNPPILHRKEEFLARDHPLRLKFARLTKQEERCRLYEESQAIGTRVGWETVLKDRGFRLAGHRVVKAST